MQDIKIKSEIDSLRQNISSYETYKKSFIRFTSGLNIKKLLSYPGIMIPPEITASFDIVTISIPESINESVAADTELGMLFDAVIVPDTDCLCCKKLSRLIKAHRVPPYKGYGEDAAIILHNESMSMLQKMFGVDLKSINILKFQEKVAVYEKLRRIIRSISAARSENHQLMSNNDFIVIIETAVSFPPDTAIELLTPLHKKIINIPAGISYNNIIKALLYGGRNIPADMADNIENKGIHIIEDDSCQGRRLFDISLNYESEYIFYELLDTYSYRPLTPCMRNVEERYELLYKMLKNYGIELLIFYNDPSCKKTAADIEYLRIRMMRDGIDPVIIDNHNYEKVITSYLERN